MYRLYCTSMMADASTLHRDDRNVGKGIGDDRVRVGGEPVKSVRGRQDLEAALPPFGVSLSWYAGHVIQCLLFVPTVASIYGGQAGYIILQNLQWEFVNIIISPQSQ